MGALLVQGVEVEPELVAAPVEGEVPGRVDGEDPARGLGHVGVAAEPDRAAGAQLDLGPERNHFDQFVRVGHEPPDAVDGVVVGAAEADGGAAVVEGEVGAGERGGFGGHVAQSLGVGSSGGSDGSPPPCPGGGRGASRLSFHSFRYGVSQTSSAAIGAGSRA